MGSIEKGPIGESDLNRWTGSTTYTFDRDTSTGGTITLLKYGTEVDALILGGGGAGYTNATITAALTAIGTTNKCTLVIRQGTWVISANVNWSAYTNVTFKIVPGATFSHSTYTMNIPNLKAGSYQIFSGTGAITLSGNVKEIYPEWWGWSTAATAANNTTYFTSAVAAMSAGHQLLTRVGTYPITNIVFNPPDGCSWQNFGTFLGDSTGVAITIGDSVGTDTNSHYTVRGIRVTSTALDHTAGRVGVLLRNLNDAFIDIRDVLNFESGVKCLGSGAGCAYNEIHLGRIWDNKYSVYLNADSSGWCNENSFYAGKLSWSAGTTKTGFRHLWLDNYAASPLNNNRFFGTSLESATTGDAATGIYCEGYNNGFIWLRYEMDVADTLINFTANSIDNVAFYGYGIPAIANVTDNGATNNIYSHREARFKGSSATGTLTLVNANSATANALRIMDNTGASEVCGIDGQGLVKAGNHRPITDDTYYVGNPSAPFTAYKGIVLHDTTDGKHYLIRVASGSVTATALD